MAKTEKVETPKTDSIDTSSWNEANINIDAWYSPEVTGKLVGRCVEAIRVNSEYGEQDVVKVRVGEPVMAILGKGEAAEKIQLVRGNIIAVRISANLTTLLELVQNECAVEIIPKGKRALKGGRAMWLYGIRWHGVRAALAQPAARTQNTAGGASDASADDGDDLPF